jgi:hypothetical protein
VWGWEAVAGIWLKGGSEKSLKFFWSTKPFGICYFAYKFPKSICCEVNGLETWEYLKPQTGRPIFDSLGDHIIDSLNILAAASL